MRKSVSMPMVTEADGQAGRRCWKKRMPPCSAVDRDSRFVPSERRADFLSGRNAPQVLLGKEDFVNLKLVQVYNGRYFGYRKWPSANHWYGHFEFGLSNLYVKECGAMLYTLFIL